ncbi:MAG: ABC transporter ATP-binding protein [Chloroflexi bacterium]|nr:ABC transporter ATP-binding protein [Chloroflexota bacterium]MXX80554.1 ABC transporter ATP-binding protein [Chloroflexota bacterium]MYD15884.1 ABC transporter ATP-binding protein [Chloroflexota bacterium]MYF23208.1 ABC transporter ATP-binding protein [Chloroflexota bacterium]MYJ00988.1 ABC transporter ATP-binding protein [Chloroflexota bacterium]
MTTPESSAEAVSLGTNTAISFDAVRKEFGSGVNATLAIESVDLEIREREFVSLIGPSGCGKSTLLRLAADLIEPSGGTVVVNGKSPRQARLDRDYGFIFQAPTLFDWRTVWKNVALPLEIMKISGMSREKKDEEIERLLGMVGLDGFERHHPYQLSGGMQQRVSLARALVFQPSILLMDEPFGALDEITRDRMNLELHRIWAETNTTILFVTHSIPEAVLLSGRVVVMTARPGRVQEIIPIDLPYPRTTEVEESTRYYELVTQVRESLGQAMAGGL